MMRNNWFRITLALAGFALGVTAHPLWASSVESSNVPPKTQNETKIIVTQEVAGDLSNADVNLELAEAVGTHFLERTRLRVNQASAQAGISVDTSRITVSTAVAKQNGKNFVINRLFHDDINYSTAFVLIEDGIATRVVCMSMLEREEVNLLGTCSSKLLAEIGFSVI